MNRVWPAPGCCAPICWMNNTVHMKKILIINGPNLNLLGVREPQVYGHASMEDCLDALRKRYADVEIEYYQSNYEGDIIDMLHKVGFDEAYAGIVLNAGAYTHYSYAIADAIAAVTRPVVEVHISNVHSREEFRRHSVISPVCRGVIAGFGLHSYRLAVEALL